MATTWDAIAPLFVREGLTRDAPAFVALVRAALDASDPLARAGSLADLARGLTRTDLASRVLATLALSDDLSARRLALELANRLPPPFDKSLVPNLSPLLRDRRVPPAVLLAAAAAMTRAAGRDRKLAVRVWADLAEGYGKRRLLADQPKLRKRFARPRNFDQFCTIVRRRMPIRCTRCRAKVASAKLPRHLWTQHGRVIEAGRVRKPWQFLDATGPDIDPAERLVELHRLMQRHRLRDVSAFDQICAAAGRDGRAICPYCWARVPVAPPARPCEVSGGRLSGHGYAVEVRDALLGPRLRVATPTGVLYSGPEPDGPATPAARRFAAAVPFIAFAALAAVVAPAPLAVLVTAVALLAALVAHRWAGRSVRRPAGDRAVEHAWRFLAFDPERARVRSHDAAFLTGLARASVGRGDPVARAATVRLWADALDPASAGVWAAFHALDAADTLASGGDPVERIAEAFGGCLDGARPFAAGVELAALSPHAAWSDDRRARLRVLVVERAFAVGLGVWDLSEIGRVAPALGAIFDSDDTDGLARLHLLWSLQKSRPWLRCGPAATAFEVAHYPDLAREHFGEAADLLLYLPVRSDGEAESLILCGRGVLFRQRLMSDRSIPVACWPRTNADGGGYAMIFGTTRLAFVESPDRIAARLECWADYWFGEFVPRAADALAMPAGPTSVALVASIATKCPTCGRTSVAQVGKVGIRVG